MLINNTGLDGLKFDASTVLTPMGELTLIGSVGTDLILPENVSDCEKILKTECQVKIEEYHSANGIITLGGTVHFNVLLLGEDGSIASVKSKEAFELKDVLDGADESTTIIIGESSCEPSCRLVNPRKINLSATPSIRVFAISEKSVIPSVKGAESIDDEISLKRHKENVSCFLPYSFYERGIPVSHDVVLDGNYPPMSEILFSGIKIIPTETKVQGSNLTVKSTALFSCIYKSEERNVFSIEKPFVLEKTVDADNADAYEWFVSGAADDLSAEVAIDNYGEAKLIELDFTYDLNMIGLKNITVDVVTDAYSTTHECKTTEVSSKCCIYKRTYPSSLSINASIERDAISSENVRAVMMGSVDIKDISSIYSIEKKRLITDATAVISAVCENNITAESDPRYSSVTFEYPFKCELDIGEINESVKYTVLISVTDVRFRCDQSKIYCDFENAIRAVTTSTAPCSYVTEIVLDKSEPILAPCSPLTLCYPAKDETLWDIAKHYKISSEEIILENNMSSEDITGKRVLLIPSFKKSS